MGEGEARYKTSFSSHQKMAQVLVSYSGYGRDAGCTRREGNRGPGGQEGGGGRARKTREKRRQGSPRGSRPGCALSHRYVMVKRPKMTRDVVISVKFYTLLSFCFFISQSFSVALNYIFIKSIVSAYQVPSSDLYTVQALLFSFTYI